MASDEKVSALTGAAFDLAQAGYAPMPEAGKKDEDDAIGSDNASLRQASERMNRPAAETIVREYLDADGKPAAPTEAVTLARAASDYASALSADLAAVENESSKALAARVDALRAEALAKDPDAAEFYGFEPPEADADKVEPDGTAKAAEADDDEPLPEGLDPELAKALRHPQVRQAIEERIGEAEKVRQSYRDGLVAATQIAQASFLGQFPELAGIAPQNLPGALEQMSRQDPAKFARVAALVSGTEQLIAQQREESRREHEAARQNFASYAQAEDARFAATLKGESREARAAVAAEIMAAAQAGGVEAAELARLFDSEPLMRHALFQQMMYEAGKFRLMMRARDMVAAQPVPPVQRPGSARTPAERAGADVRALSARLSSSGNIKDAVALYHARKSSRR